MKDDCHCICHPKGIQKHTCCEEPVIRCNCDGFWHKSVLDENGRHTTQYLDTSKEPDYDIDEQGNFIPKLEPLKEDSIDTLVRDACSVVPVAKSEYRKRLLAWKHKAVIAELEKFGTTVNPFVAGGEEWCSDCELPQAITKRIAELEGEQHE